MCLLSDLRSAWTILTLTNSYLKNSGFTDNSQEIILVRNTILRNESKQINKINQSLESIFEKLKPQGNPYPSPFPLKSKWIIASPNLNQY